MYFARRDLLDAQRFEATGGEIAVHEEQIELAGVGHEHVVLLTRQLVQRRGADAVEHRLVPVMACVVGDRLALIGPEVCVVLDDDDLRPVIRQGLPKPIVVSVDVDAEQVKLPGNGRVGKNCIQTVLALGRDEATERFDAGVRAHVLCQFVGALLVTLDIDSVPSVLQQRVRITVSNTVSCAELDEPTVLNVEPVAEFLYDPIPSSPFWLACLSGL